MIDLWVHLIALTVYVVATLGLCFYTIPMALRDADPASRLARAARALKVYDPLSIAALGVIVMTGAFSLTAIKDALRENFFVQMGPVLFWKLLFTFILIMVAAYLAFGVGNRIVGHSQLEEPPEDAWVVSMLRRGMFASVLALILCGVVVWVAVGMN